MMRLNIEGLEIKKKRIDGAGFKIRNFKIIFGKGNTHKNIILQKKKGSFHVPVVTTNQRLRASNDRKKMQ